VYVANSEPAIWPWEGGRAGMAERDPVSGPTCLRWSGTGYGEGARLTQGSPPALTPSKAAGGVRKPKPTRRPPSGQGAEGGRSTGSTEDSGPMKPGNSGEGKTLTTRKGREPTKSLDGEPAACDGQHTPSPE
jgi:hypothetical protein